MEKNDILKIVNEVFIDVLDNDHIVLTNASTADDVDEWDSLTHVHLIVAIEKRFKIRFKSDEMSSWKNVGEMVESIEGKL